MAIHKPSSKPRFFNNMFNDDYYSLHIFLMANGEKVKPKSKPPPPSDTSSSEDGKYKQLEEQYSILRDSNSHPSKAKDASTPSTSQDCGKCYNLDLNAYSTNLANMETMRKEIKRLNEFISKIYLGGKAQVSDKKENDPKGPQFKHGRQPSIKHELRYTTRAKTNRRKIIKGYKCVKFERKGKIGVEWPHRLRQYNVPM